MEFSFSYSRCAAAVVTALAIPQLASAQAAPLDEVIVTADFRQSTIEELPISVSVLAPIINCGNGGCSDATSPVAPSANAITNQTDNASKNGWLL